MLFLVIADVRLAGSRHPAIAITLIILCTVASVARYCGADTVAVRRAERLGVPGRAVGRGGAVRGLPSGDSPGGTR
ncbi:hypothetical protein GCM10018781_02950 [Kitasatospora indigofera]|uniref:Uncharacterized protein n=1 Tax=Kitasatospora indigofera TaxID=67307 RepID=A0A919FBW4_9ACTN|nr:hypothetical protein [Kitasatospora indigofera]GHH59554.1 hypothetical protein GCM10018781_02950 [Kitasatospora indigofera]